MAETGPDWGRLPALEAARRRSLALEARARALLEGATEALAGVATVALCGSLGRLEAGADADVDCVVVTDDPAAARDGTINGVLDGLGLRGAKAWGIYREPVTEASLLDRAALGSLDEPPAVFGKRMQLLLDARPAWGDARFAALQAALLDFYGHGFLAETPARGWTYLTNDLARYLHAYSAWQQYKFERTADDSWLLRQAKLRATRIPTIAALLLCLGDTWSAPDKQARLLGYLRLTPLERLHAVMAPRDPAAFDRLAAAWEKCHRLLGDREVRRALVAGGPASAGELGSSRPAAYAALHEASGEVLATLTAFTLDRRDEWPHGFFERLLF